MLEALQPLSSHTQRLPTKPTHCSELRDVFTVHTLFLAIKSFKGSEVRRERSELELERMRRQEQSPKVLVIEITLFAHQNGICIRTRDYFVGEYS